MTPEAVVRQWFEQVWTEKREEAIDRLLAADANIHDLTPGGSPMQGPAAFKPYRARIIEAFPDLRIDVVQTVTEGNMVAAYCRVTATHGGKGLGIEATGRTVTINGMVMARVEGDRIAEGWNCFDFLSLYQQIGAVPAFS